jgi:hypothetical protein
MPGLNQASHAAIVSRSQSNPAAPGQYLLLTPSGASRWTDDPEEATAFESMREALQAATRLPSALRAYSIPLQAERLAQADLH